MSLVSCSRLGLGGSELLRALDWVAVVLVTMATAVSDGAATTGVRVGVGLCSCAVTMATAVSAGAATATVRGGVGLCSCADSVIILSSEFGVLEYVYGQ